MLPIFLKYWTHQLMLQSEDGGTNNFALNVEQHPNRPTLYQISSQSRIESPAGTLWSHSYQVQYTDYGDIFLPAGTLWSHSYR